jgi:hypothetical protein
MGVLLGSGVARTAVDQTIHVVLDLGRSALSMPSTMGLPTTGSGVVTPSSVKLADVRDP